MAGRPGRGWRPHYFLPFPAMMTASSKTSQSPSFFGNVPSLVRRRVWVTLSSLSTPIVVRHRHHHPHPHCLLIVVFTTPQGFATDNGAIIVAANGTIVGATEAKIVLLRQTRDSNCCHRCYVHVVIVASPSHPSTVILQHTLSSSSLLVAISSPPFVWLIVVCGNGSDAMSTSSSPIRSLWLLLLLYLSLSAPSLLEP